MGTVAKQNMGPYEYENSCSAKYWTLTIWEQLLGKIWDLNNMGRVAKQNMGP